MGLKTFCSICCIFPLMRYRDYYTVGLVKRKGSPMTAKIKVDRNTPFSLLKALALSLARDIDCGDRSARVELEAVMALIPNSPKGRFA